MSEFKPIDLPGSPANKTVVYLKSSVDPIEYTNCFASPKANGNSLIIMSCDPDDVYVYAEISSADWNRYENYGKRSQKNIQKMPSQKPAQKRQIDDTVMMNPYVGGNPMPPPQSPVTGEVVVHRNQRPRAVPTIPLEDEDTAWRDKTSIPGESVVEAASSFSEDSVVQPPVTSRAWRRITGLQSGRHGNQKKPPTQTLAAIACIPVLLFFSLFHH